MPKNKRANSPVRRAERAQLCGDRDPEKMSAAGKENTMKRSFLAQLELVSGGNLANDDIEAIMAEYGRSKTAADNTIAQLTAERDGLQQQLEGANEEIQSYKEMDIEGIKAAAASWEQKYTADTEALKQELADANYGFAVKEAADGLKFSSESAKKAFVAELTAKGLPLQEGKLLGMDDFVSAYKETDPKAFAEVDEKVPIITSGGTGTGAASISAEESMRAIMGLPPKK